MTPELIQKSAEALSLARRGGPATNLPPEEFQPSTVEEGYDVQEVLHQILSDDGWGALVGHKIGCTTQVMQQYLSIDHPCAGEVFESSVHHGSAELPLSQFHRIGVECEIAARLSKPLGDIGTPYTRENVRGAVGALMAGIELVDDRYVNYPSFPAPTLIADDFFNVGVVLGEEVEDWQSLDLENIEGAMIIDGAEVGRGRGADILGHPMEALAWLANHRIARGMPLEAGTFIMLGSVVKTVHFDKAADVTIRFEGLGEASVQFT